MTSLELESPPVGHPSQLSQPQPIFAVPVPVSALKNNSGMSGELSSGALKAIYQGDQLDFSPVFQVLQFKKHQAEGTTPRFRLVISDGLNHLLVVASTLLNDQIEKEVKKYCVIQVNTFNVSQTKNKRVLIISSFVFLKEATSKIGSPVEMDPGSSTGGGQEGKQGTPQPDSESIPNQNHPSPSPPVASASAAAPIPPPQQKMQQVTQHSSPAPSAPRPIHPAQSVNPAPTRQQQQQQQQQQQPPQRSFQQNQQRQQQQQQQQQQGKPTPKSSPLKPGSLNPGGRGWPQLQNQPAPKVETPVSIFPIASLNPYQHRWVIQARVTAKSPIKSWNNQRGEGKLFNFELIDSSGEIKALAFNDAVDKFYEGIQVGQVYFISRCTLRTASRQFGNAKNPYELQIDFNSEIAPCDTETDIPTVNFNPSPISAIEGANPGDYCDILAIVIDPGEAVTIKTKRGDALKRTITLLDESGSTIKLTIWGDRADSPDFQGNPVFLLKGMRISDFNGRSLSASDDSMMVPNPDIPEAQALRQWFESSGKETKPRSLSAAGPSGASSNVPRKTIYEVKNEHLGQTEGKPDDFYLKVYPLAIPHDGNISYPGCPGEECNKKVIEEAPNQWHCEKCGKSYPNCRFRYSLSVSVADFTGQIWTRVFGDPGANILGQTADSVMDWKNTGDPSFDIVFQEALFRPLTLKVRAKLDSYEGNVRTTYQVQSAYPIDFQKDSKRLLAEISKYE